MSNRINIKNLEPEAYKAMMGLEKYLETSKVTPMHKDLIKIRASQINGCAFCLDMHTREARAHGETEQRIYALPGWRDAPYFTEQERAILALTEEVTLITGRVSDETYNAAANLLEEHYLAQVIMAIVTINGWNRMSIATRLAPPVDA